MNKFVHIVFGDSAAGNLKYFLNNNINDFKEEIINFREDHSFGPIYKIDTEAGVKKRIKWLSNIIKMTFAYAYFENFEEEILDSYKKLENIEVDSKIVIWHGKNIGDQVGLRYLASLLKNYDLYQVDVSKFNYKSLAQCSSENIEEIILSMEKLEKENRRLLEKEWKFLRKNRKNLRILNVEEIISVDENYYDEEILLNCSYNFKTASLIIGNTMGYSKQLVSDTYIDYRIRKLIENNLVEYDGKLETMRDFKIKISGGLNEFFQNKFNKNIEKTKDGYYYFKLFENPQNELSNSLVIKYNDENLFSLSLIEEGRSIVNINDKKIARIKFINKLDNESIVLNLEDLKFLDLKIQIRPYLSITF